MSVCWQVLLIVTRWLPRQHGLAAERPTGSLLCRLGLSLVLCGGCATPWRPAHSPTALPAAMNQPPMVTLPPGTPPPGTAPAAVIRHQSSVSTAGYLENEAVGNEGDHWRYPMASSGQTTTPGAANPSAVQLAQFTNPAVQQQADQLWAPYGGMPAPPNGPTTPPAGTLPPGTLPPGGYGSPPETLPPNVAPPTYAPPAEVVPPACAWRHLPTGAGGTRLSPICRALRTLFSTIRNRSGRASHRQRPPGCTDSHDGHHRQCPGGPDGPFHAGSCREFQCGIDGANRTGRT